MKINNYTIPKISTINENEINDLFYISYYLPHLRLLYLEGIPVRIELNKNKYVELSSNEEEVELEDYSKVFEKLFSFFYGTAYLYGVIKNKKLKIYDIYTNDNYFSSKDLLFIESNYGLPIAKPIFEGRMQSNFLIEILNKKINGEGMKSDCFHILPSVYIDDKRENKPVEFEPSKKILFGEKEKTYNYTTSTTQNTPQLPSTILKTNKKIDPALLEVFEFSSKDERASIFKETLRNVESYYKIIKDKLTEEQKKWWDSNGKFITYLYSIVSLPGTRQIVYDYSCFYFLDSLNYSLPIEKKWGLLFSDFFKNSFESLLKTKKIEKIPEDMLSIFFKEEFIEFDKFFVKETNKNEDWRYGENLIGCLAPEEY